jgi:hypothetical protein
MDRARAAEVAFRNYDFGHRVEIEEDVNEYGGEGVVDPAIAAQFKHETREWQYTSAGREWTRPVYVRTDGDGDVAYWVRLIFTVRFYPSSDRVTDVYALDNDGSIWGRIPEKAEWRPNGDESLLKGPWAWREISDEKNATIALILETAARPNQDPVIMQALVGKRILTVGERAAALELIRLAPEMLLLLAKTVQASKKTPEKVFGYVAEAECLLDDLTRNHHSVAFRVPGYWSAEE